MAATYTMQEMKDLHNENETILYPRMIIKGQCSTSHHLQHRRTPGHDYGSERCHGPRNEPGIFGQAR